MRAYLVAVNLLAHANNSPESAIADATTDSLIQAYESTPAPIRRSSIG